MSQRAAPTKPVGRKKELLLFQRDLLRLERDQFAALDDHAFVSGLDNYLKSLHQKEKIDTVVRLLDKFRAGCCTPKIEHRERLLFLISRYAETVMTSQSRRSVEAIAEVFTHWLQHEQQLIPGFESVCAQIHAFLRWVAPQGMSQAMVQLVLTLQAIQQGGIAKPAAIRKIIDRLFQQLLAEKVLNPAAFANQKLALIGGEETVSPRGRFIQELYTSESKDRRLELVDLLSHGDPSMAEELVRLAGKNPPWYVVRNIISILANLTPAPPERYLLSYLDFPDQRIQRQVIEAVEKTGGDTARDKWLLALASCDNEIKLQVIPKLAASGGTDVEAALIGVLRDWRRIEGDRQDEILEAVATELGNYPSVRVAFALESFIRARFLQYKSGDHLTEVARNTLKRLWQG
ncbi:MAG: hypothetical protein LBU39_08885 [Desulfobulbaceae bacterium]|nr:hypothetical protein [Desulfobulbaceae bacterium]